jgi:hypothetical protein
MSGYTKLFSTIITSTIWREPKEIKILWITMLALADKNGMVEASVPGLSDMARLTVEETQEGLRVLLAPDAYSRTQIEGGRRILAMEGGWFLVNHEKYRDMLGVEERREYLRKKQAELRSKRKQMSTPVATGIDKSTPSTHSEAAPKASAETNTSPKAPRPRNPLFDVMVEVTGANPAVSGGEIGKALAAIKTVTPDVTPEEIKRRAANYRTLMPDCTLSASALAKWWPKCGESGSKGFAPKTMEEARADPNYEKGIF